MSVTVQVLQELLLRELAADRTDRRFHFRRLKNQRPFQQRQQRLLFGGNNLLSVVERHFRF